MLPKKNSTASGMELACIWCFDNETEVITNPRCDSFTNLRDQSFKGLVADFPWRGGYPQGTPWAYRSGLGVAELRLVAFFLWIWKLLVMATCWSWWGGHSTLEYSGHTLRFSDGPYESNFLRLPYNLPWIDKFIKFPTCMMLESGPIRLVRPLAVIITYF